MEHAGSLSRVLVEEGWGRNRALEPYAASLRSNPGLQARTRTASEGRPGAGPYTGCGAGYRTAITSICSKPPGVIS